MKYNRRKFKFYIFSGLLLSIIGIVAILGPVFVPELIPEGLGSIIMIVGIACAFLGILFLLAAASQVYQARVIVKNGGVLPQKPAKRGKAAKAQQQQQQFAPAAQQQMGGGCPYASCVGQNVYWYPPVYVPQQPVQTVAMEPNRRPPEPVPLPIPQPMPEPAYIPAPEPNYAQQPAAQEVQYFPNASAYDRVNLGPKQSVEEKFVEISKMDRTQFVVYVAKLFSIKGYTVKYTPVIDNFNIDLIVEKMGVVIAVGCILTNKVLGEMDIRPVANGRVHYPASNVMVLTNMYFDRTALNFAKNENMSLVDRNILAEDFM